MQTFTADPHDIVNARAALLLLACPTGLREGESVETLYQAAEAALRRTYGDLSRPDVSVGELRRATFCSALRRMSVGEVHDASRRLDD